MKPLIVDALASGKGTRLTTRDVIGAGPRTVAGVFEAHGFSPVIVPVEKYLREKNISSSYDLLLVSGMTLDIPAMSRVIRRWRKDGRGMVIVGGPSCSEPHRILRKTDADIAVIGEGEASISELMEGKVFEGSKTVLPDVRGISYRIDGEIFVNPLRPVQSKEIFSKYRASVNTVTGYELYESSRVYVEAVRGCSNFHRARIGSLGENCSYCEQCTESGLTERYECPVGIPPGCGYCSVPSLYGPPKSRPREIIVSEVEKLLDLGVHRIVLSAPGFLDYGRDLLVEPEPLTDPRFPEPNYNELEVLLRDLTGLPEMERGEASLMVENVKASLVSVRAAGILGRYLRSTPVSVGFETGSPQHSVQLGRPDTPSETLSSLKRLKNVGMKPYVYFIHGLPGQTHETAKETASMIQQSMAEGAERVILYRFKSLPMSAFNDCPSGAPAVHDPHSKLIYDAAQKANRESKKDLIGEKMWIVIADKYNRDKRFSIGYPMLHGPVVLIEGEYERGKVLRTRITGVASERMVYGEKLG